VIPAALSTLACTLHGGRLGSAPMSGTTSSGAFNFREIFILCLTTILIVVQVTIKRHLLNWRRITCLTQCIEAAITDMAYHCCLGNAMARNGRKSPWRHEIHQLVATSRVEDFQRSLAVIQTFCFIGCVKVMSKLAFQTQHDPTFWQDSIMCSMFLLALVLESFPVLMHERMLDLWHTLIMVGVFSYSLPGVCEPAVLPVADDMVMLASWVTSLQGMSTPLVVLWNVFRWTMKWPIAQSVEGRGWEVVFGFRLGELIAVCYYGWVMEKKRYEKARKAVEARLLMQRQSANDALLSTFYDVVVEVNARLEICTGAEELARFLYSLGVALDGVDFAELLPLPEDQQVFKERMRHTPLSNSQEVTDVMHMTLSCNAAESRQVEIFSHQYMSGGCSRHLLGIRDHSKDSPGAPLPLRLDVGAAEETRNPALLAEVTVLVDAGIDSMPILDCCDGFRSIVGACASVSGAQLEEVVDDAEQLLSWIQQVSNAGWSDAPDGELERLNRFKLVLLPQGAHPVQGSCKVLFQDEEVKSVDEEQCNTHAFQGDQDNIIPVRLSICNLRLGRRVETRRRRTRHSSHSRSSSMTSSSGTPRDSFHVPLGTEFL